MAADSISKKIKEVHGDDGAVSSLIGEARAEQYVNNYIDRVIRFKIYNHIGPQNRIEAPKIAAILITQLYRQPITDMFSFKENYQSAESPYPNVARGGIL